MLPGSWQCRCGGEDAAEGPVHEEGLILHAVGDEAVETLGEPEGHSFLVTLALQ